MWIQFRNPASHGQPDRQASSARLSFPTYLPSLLPRVVELLNAILAVNTNRPRFSEMVWTLDRDNHTVKMLVVGARKVGRAGEGKDEFIRIRAFRWRFESRLVSHRAEMRHRHACPICAVNRNHLGVVRAVDGLFESGAVRD